MSDRPFVDRPVGDVEDARALAEHVATQLDLASPTLMRVGMNALFATGHVVIRVGRPSAPARLALELAGALGALGIEVPSPATADVFIDGGLAATCWQRLAVRDVETDWRRVGEIVRTVHSLRPDDLPVGYPIPKPTTFPWWDFDGLLAEIGPEIDAAAFSGLERTIERNRGWTAIAPGTSVVCHGDVHPGNVVMTDDGPVVLDWDLMCTAPRGWDHAMLLTLADRWGGDPGVYPAFAAGYGESLADDVTTRRFAVLRNVAATLMRVRAGRTDPVARHEADRRLRYWRGEVDAPLWTAQ